MRKRFKDRLMQQQYETFLRLYQDNWSSLYLARNTGGWIMGPHLPLRGASVRCAFWDGYQGKKSLFEGLKGSASYACWRAGVDQRNAERQEKGLRIAPQAA